MFLANYLQIFWIKKLYPESDKTKSDKTKSDPDLESVLDIYSFTESNLDFALYLAEYVDEFYPRESISPDILFSIHRDINYLCSNIFSNGTNEDITKGKRLIDIIMRFTFENIDHKYFVSLICSELVNHITSRYRLLNLPTLNDIILRERSTLYGLIKENFRKNQNERINKLHSLMIMVSFFLTPLRRSYGQPKNDWDVFSLVKYDPDIIPFLKYLDEDTPFYCNLFANCANNIPKEVIIKYFPKMKHIVHNIHFLMKDQNFCVLCRELATDIINLREIYYPVDEISTDIILPEYIFYTNSVVCHPLNIVSDGFISKYLDNNPDSINRDVYNFFHQNSNTKNNKIYFLHKIMKSANDDLVSYLYFSDLIDIKTIILAIETLKRNNKKEKLSVQFALDTLNLIGNNQIVNDSFMNSLLYNVLDLSNEVDQIENLLGILLGMGLKISIKHSYFFALPLKYIISTLENTSPKFRREFHFDIFFDRLKSSPEDFSNVINLIFEEIDPTHMEDVIHLLYRISIPEDSSDLEHTQDGILINTSLPTSSKYRNNIELLKKEINSYISDLTDDDLIIFKMRLILGVWNTTHHLVRVPGTNLLIQSINIINQTIYTDIISNDKYLGILSLIYYYRLYQISEYNCSMDKLFKMIGLLREKYSDNVIVQNSLSEFNYLYKISDISKFLYDRNNLEEMFKMSENVVKLLRS